MHDYLVIDTETELAGPRGTAPPAFVVMGWRNGLGQAGWITNRGQAHDVVRAALALGQVVVAHNLAFDLGVLGVRPRRHHRVWCTGLADILIRLARDDCSLERARRVVGPPAMRKLGECLGLELEGKESTRLSFRPGVRLTEEQLDYLDADVRAHERLYLRQVKIGVPGGLPELNLQLRARMALDQLTLRGIPIDRAEIRRQLVEFGKQRRGHRRDLQEGGIYIPGHTGPKGGRYQARLDTKAFREHVERLASEAAIDIERTESGLVSTSSDVLRAFGDDPLVSAWLDYKGAEKIEGYLRAWDIESGRIHPGYRSMARTGRTTCHGPNLQQVPSRGAKGGVKRVFRAEQGCVLYEADYKQLELCTLAYLTKGTMLQFINEGRDLHRELGALFFGKPAAEVTDAERQFMKEANFGFPGGMGLQKFRLRCRARRIPDPGLEGARKLKDAWLKRYPEMVEWLAPREEEPARDLQKIWSGGRVEDDMAWIDTNAGHKRLVYIRGGKVEPSYRRLGRYAWDVAEELAVARRIPEHLVRAARSGKGSLTLATWLVGRRVEVVGGRVRYPVTYTEQRNTPFQGLAANLTKDALARLVLDEGCCVHAFIHDSILFSFPADLQDTGARRVVDIMLDAARTWIPGVRAGVELVGPGDNWFSAKNGAVQDFFVSV